MALYIDSQGKQKRYPNTLFHKEKDREDYFLVFTDSTHLQGGGLKAYWAYSCYTAIPVDWDNADCVPDMGYTTVSFGYLEENCDHVVFSSLPEAWQDHFREYIEHSLSLESL